MHSDLINIAMVVEYDGSGFYGFQKQAPGVRTIQGELEQALSAFAGDQINIVTSGRTDAKVHAVYQVINFKTRIKRPLYNWVCGVNSILPDDIVLREAIIVENEFHARYATNRTYHYYLVVDSIRPAILRNKVGWCYSPLNIEHMTIAQQGLVGERDFSSFRATGCQALNPVRNLSKVGLFCHNNLIRFEFTANAFLYHMVRNMVGALVYVGKGILSPHDLNDLVEAKSRKFAPPTFMPDGLYLANVEYPNAQFTYQPPNCIY